MFAENKRFVCLIALNIIISVSIQGQIPYDSFTGEDEDYDDYYDDYDDKDDDNDYSYETKEDEITVINDDENNELTPESSSTTVEEVDESHSNNITVSDSAHVKSKVNIKGKTSFMKSVHKNNLENSTILKVDDMIVIANGKEDDTGDDELNPWIVEDINNLQNRRIIVNNRMRGLQNGMDALVETLKIISEHLGCENKGLCSPPFNRVSSGECLYVNLDHRKSWAFAREYCQSIGADLAQPETITQDMDYITRLKELDILGGRDRFWVGASDRNVEGIWRWVSGRRVSQDIGWTVNQPRDITGKEDCMAMVIKHPPSAESLSCFRRKPFICQKHI